MPRTETLSISPAIPQMPVKWPLGDTARAYRAIHVSIQGKEFGVPWWLGETRLDVKFSEMHGTGPPLSGGA